MVGLPGQRGERGFPGLPGPSVSAPSPWGPVNCPWTGSLQGDVEEIGSEAPATPPCLWPDSLSSLRVSPANKVLLERAANAVPPAPWAPLVWLDPLVNLDAR